MVWGQLGLIFRIIKIKEKINVNRKLLLNIGLGKIGCKRYLGDIWRKVIMDWVLDDIRELFVILVYLRFCGYIGVCFREEEFRGEV